MVLQLARVRGCSMVWLLLVSGVMALAQSAGVVIDRKDADSWEPIQSHLDPASYPLAHFVDVGRSDFKNASPLVTLCLGCPKGNGRPVTLSDYSVQVEKRRVGLFSGHAVLEVHMTFTPKPGWSREAEAAGIQDPVVWKMILAESAHGLYRQIYGIYSSGEYMLPLSWAEMVNLGGRHILASNDPMNGNDSFCSDGYWNLDRPDLERMDFSSVDTALNDYAPKGSVVLESRCWALDLETGTVRTVARRGDPDDTSGNTAELTLHFHLEGSHVIPDHIESQSTVGNE